MRNGHAHVHNVFTVKSLILHITLLAALGFAPAFINSDTTSVWPSYIAQYKGVSRV